MSVAKKARALAKLGHRVCGAIISATGKPLPRDREALEHAVNIASQRAPAVISPLARDALVALAEVFPIGKRAELGEEVVWTMPDLDGSTVRWAVARLREQAAREHGVNEAGLLFGMALELLAEAGLEDAPSNASAEAASAAALQQNGARSAE